ncbi:TPA: threonine/serine exporter [Enterococcus faecalis]|uniref:threonine/serine exporter family protein n=1 Tax=Enterococcus TaxID=1350 RepID=UPI001141710A|nr:threonine/serine exporter family protein [Enterococcus faecalis]EGO8342726.1 threonine/serine exporter [Enterococcus faecalis]EGO8777123.1 threonine/serine exporter [Enterococcus faecalis]EGO9398252.1 threonine/serine exporter [Enterococcus faecalis]EHL2448071.1 threonine/serine exporter family protein [Enterococcus faecalis]EIA0404516.1 threonine/serine exporter family protein [Enterococcus faecalis]
MELIFHLLFSFLATVTFGIITNIPRKALVACGITGMIGWMIYYVLTQTFDASQTFANFLGTVGLGIASIFFSRYKKMPMIIFYIPSLVPLVPGGPAYQAVRSILLGNIDDGLQLILKVVFTAAAIAAGFMVTSLLERIVKRFSPKRLFRLVKK